MARGGVGVEPLERVMHFAGFVPEGHRRLVRQLPDYANKRTSPGKG